MKGILLGILCMGIVFVFCPQAFGFGFGTPVIDGALDACYGAADATDQSGDGNGNAVMDLGSLYVCNDASYWYFYFTINANIDVTRWGKYALYIDTTNDPNGATLDAWTRNVVVSAPHKPEFGIYTWVDVVPYGTGNTQVWSWGGTSWTGIGAMDGAARGIGSTSALEWKIAKSRIGDPTEIWCEVWSTGGGSNDNAQDTSNNPPEDWNAADWSTTAVLLCSTHVARAAGGDVIPPTVVNASSYAAPHNTILVEFSEPVDLNTSQTPGNYTVNSGAVTVLTATRDAVDFSKVTLGLNSNLSYGGSNDVLVTNVKDLAGNPIVNNGTTNKACFCLSRVVFKVHMNLHLRTHSVPPDQLGIEGNVYPLNWDPTCDILAADDGVSPDAVAGDSLYTVAIDFSRPSNCLTGTDTTWVEFEYTHLCTEWEGHHHYYSNPGLTCSTGIDTFSVWWADIAPDNYTSKPIDVIFRVDMSSKNPGVQDTVSVNGSEYPLNWNVPPTTFMKDDGVAPDSLPGDKIYSVRVRFPINTWKTVEYKYLFNSAFECSLSGNRNVVLNDAVYDTVGVNPLILPVASWGDYCVPEGIGGVPENRAFRLEQNVPNPFNPVTTFEFTLPKAGRATLTVYDAAGRTVKVLVDKSLDAGLQKAIWDGTDSGGTKVPSGVYFYELKSEGLQTSRKLVIVY